MDNRKLPELKAEAKRLGLNNYSRLRKQELIDLLRNQRTPLIEPLTKKIRAPGTKKIPALGSPVRTKKIPLPTRKIEMSPKELERKVKKIEKETESNQSKNKKQQKEKTESSSTTVKIETGK